MQSILIVEDDVSSRFFMEQVLLLGGFDVRSSSSGHAILDLLRERKPDLILCDIMMPDMDGYSVLEAIKREPAFAAIPFIFVSARGERPDVRRGMLEGADDYLPKPFSPAELLATITRRLHRIEMHRVQNSTNIIPIENQKLLRQLTPREHEVLIMVGKGLTTKEIAGLLGIRDNTVDVYRSSLLKKLDAENAAALTRWAIIAELSNPPDPPAPAEPY